MKVTKEILAQHWVHSHEEDTDTETVFRPSTWKFPPSRGRKSFDLQTDGSLVVGGIAPTDRRQLSEGKWGLEGDTLKFYTASEAKPDQTMQITAAEKDRLVVKK